MLRCLLKALLSRARDGRSKRQESGAAKIAAGQTSSLVAHGLTIPADDDVAALVATATKLLAAGAHEPAFQIANEILRKDPNRADALSVLGMVLREWGDT